MQYSESQSSFQHTESQQRILESFQAAKSDILGLPISEVQVYPILWNKASSEYKETHKNSICDFFFSGTKQVIAIVVPGKAPSFMFALLRRRP